MPELGSRSATLLTFLLRLPRIVLVLGVVAILLAGAFVPGVIGSALVVVIAGLLGWLAWLNWGSSSPGARVARVAAIALLLTYAVTKL